MTHARPQTPPAQRPLAYAPNDYARLVAAADAHRRRGEYDEALRAFHALTVQFPERADAFSNFAAMLQSCGHPTHALQAINRALEMDPSSVPALKNAAEIFKDFGEWDTVLETYDAALALAPRDAELHFARGLHLLLLGRWAEGWRGHEARLHLPSLQLGAGRITTPRWDGSPLGGRHIVLDCEQGLGDQVMLARFARDVAARGGRVTLRCGPPLVELFSALRGVSAVVSERDAVPAHDVHASLMSLPHLLGIDSPMRLDGSPYLVPVGPCPVMIDAALEHNRSRVGLVWCGNPQHRNDARRSITPDRLAPLFEDTHVQWVSLQRHEGMVMLPEPLRGRVTDLGGALRSMNDTAHALARLDLLVTVDTSVAHLAGALGVPTLLMVPFVPDWRWMTGRSDTPWYDSVRLVRQPALFDWDGVIDIVRRRVAHVAPGTR